MPSRQAKKRATKRRIVRRRNVAGFYDEQGIFHPIRSDAKYDSGRAGETSRSRKPRRTRSKKKLAQRAKAAATARKRAAAKKRAASKKQTAKRTARRSVKRTARRNPQASIKIGPLKLSAGATWESKKKNPTKRKKAKRKTVTARTRNYSSLVIYKQLSPVRKGEREGYRFGGKFYARGSGSVTLRRGYILDRGTGYIYKKEVLNPKRKRRTNPTAAERTYRKFQGRPSRKTANVEVPAGQGGEVAKLGKLILIQTDKVTVKPARTIYLTADKKNKLVLATHDMPMVEGPVQNLGRIKIIEYQTAKSHLGDRSEKIYFHHMGERGGVKPTLWNDGRGGLVIKGGSYQITSRGIEH